MVHDLKIPKHPVRVQMRDDLGQVQSAEIWVADARSPGAPAERLQDVLNARRFVPVRNDEEFAFVQVQHICWMKVELLSALDELDPEAEGSTNSVSAGVKVQLVDGSSLEGGIRYLLPAAARRVGDYLEGLPAFFPLRTPDWVYLVNRDRVVRVIPIDEVTS